MTYRPSTSAGPNGPAFSDAYGTDACTVCDAVTDALHALDGEHVCASCYERDAMDAEAFAVEPYADHGHVFPGMARAEAIAEDAALVLAHMNAVGVTFNARRKVGEAEEFSFLRGGSALAIPSKLSGVTAFQGDVARLGAALVDLDALTPGAARSYPAKLYKGTDEKGAPVVVVMAETVPGDPVSLRALGMLADKHAAWVGPVLSTVPQTGAVTEASSPVRVYVTAVTGGTPDRPTRGVNVAIHGTADAVRAFYDTAAIEAHRENACGSGSRDAVEAAVE